MNIFLFAFSIFIIVHFIYFRNDPEIVEGKYEVLYEGLRPTFWSKIYSTLFIMRRVTLAVFLVFVRNVIFQLIIIISVQVSALSYMLIVRPFDEAQDNIINTINELVIVVITCIFVTLRKDAGLSDKEVETRTQIAIYIISFAGVVVFIISMVFAVKLIIEFIREYLKKRKEEYEKRMNDGKLDIDVSDLGISKSIEICNQMGSKLDNIDISLSE